MNPGLVVKLRPSGPWRIGPDSGARNRVDVIYHSDSLYSAVTAAMSRLGWLEDWLDATARTGAPAVSFSSCFPYLDDVVFIVPPRTVWPPASPSTRAARVRWKSARFVPLAVVQSILAGERLDENQWSVDGPSDCLVPAGKPGPFRTAVRSSAGVDRLTGASERHSIACIEFRAGSGLWTVVSFADESAQERWSAKVKAAFRLLADTGFGGERSRGWGRSDAPEFTDGMLPDLILPLRTESAATVEPVEGAEAAVIAVPEVAPPVEMPPESGVPPVEVAAEPTPEAPAAEDAAAELVEGAAVLAPPEVAPLVREPRTVAGPEAPAAEAAPAESPAAEPEALAAESEAPAAEAAVVTAPEVAAAEETAAGPVEGAEAAVLAPPDVAPLVREPGTVAEPGAPTVEAVVTAPEAPGAESPAAESLIADPEARAPETAPAAESEGPAAEAVGVTAPEAPAAETTAAPAVEAPAPVAEVSAEAPAPGPEQPVVDAAPAHEPEVPIVEATLEPEAPAVETATVIVATAPTHPHWLLSLFTPAPADSVDWRRGNYTVLPRGGRVDSPAGSGELKKQIQMVAEGSVLYAETAPRGSAADVAPDGFAHPVFRAGFAVAIPLPEVR